MQTPLFLQVPALSIKPSCSPTGPHYDVLLCAADFTVLSVLTKNHSLALNPTFVSLKYGVSGGTTSHFPECLDFREHRMPRSRGWDQVKVRGSAYFLALSSPQLGLRFVPLLPSSCIHDGFGIDLLILFEEMIDKDTLCQGSHWQGMVAI